MCWQEHVKCVQVKNALARAAGEAGAGLLEVLLPLETLQQGAKVVHAAFREALLPHRRVSSDCARALPLTAAIAA